MPYDDPEIQFDEDVFAFHQRLIALRRQNSAIREGFFYPVLVDDAHDVLSYAREIGDERTYVVLNRSAVQRDIELKLPDSAEETSKKWINWLDDAQAQLIVQKESDVVDARPALRLIPGGQRIMSSGGTLGITLPAYGSAVLTEDRGE